MKENNINKALHARTWCGQNYLIDEGFLSDVCLSLWRHHFMSNIITALIFLLNFFLTIKNTTRSSLVYPLKFRLFTWAPKTSYVCLFTKYQLAYNLSSIGLSRTHTKQLWWMINIDIFPCFSLSDEAFKSFVFKGFNCWIYKEILCCHEC